MGEKAKGQPPKAVIAVPAEPVRKAGGKVLEFPSVKAAAAFFGLNKNTISRFLVHGQEAHPACGYYFDYKIDD